MAIIPKFHIRQRSRFEQYGISPATLAFYSQDDESKYQSLVLRASLIHIRLSLLFALILISAYGIFDPFVYADSDTLLYVLAVRYLLILPPVLLLLLLTF